MSEKALSNERILDVREIRPGVRHTMIAQLFMHLGSGETLQLIVDHDPRRLRAQLEVANKGGILWNYLEQGPDVWRVRIGRGTRT